MGTISENIKGKANQLSLLHSMLIREQSYKERIYYLNVYSSKSLPIHFGLRSPLDPYIKYTNLDSIYYSYERNKHYQKPLLHKWCNHS